MSRGLSVNMLLIAGLTVAARSRPLPPPMFRSAVVPGTVTAHAPGRRYSRVSSSHALRGIAGQTPSSRKRAARSFHGARAMHHPIGEDEFERYWDKLEPDKILSSLDLHGVAKWIRSGKANNIVVMVGAGMSVSSGIPDFRSPGTGLYDNLQKYDLPYPEAIFDLNHFQTKPGAFNLLAKELYPGNFEATPAHYFVRLLHEKGLLLRCFTQNIDSLESQAGLSKDKIVAAHGNFDGAACIKCGAHADPESVRQTLELDGEPSCAKCGGLVKPNIVFFGEALPERFFTCAHNDMPKADLLVVLGTSLTVHPFAGLVGQVSNDTPRLLINREMVGQADPTFGPTFSGGFFNFGIGNTRDALFLGDCDDGVQQLVDLLDWGLEFDALLNKTSATL